MAGGAALALAPLLGIAAQSAPEASDAPIALLVDLSSGQNLHAHEADRRFLPASTTKVMTAFLAFEKIAEGKLDPDEVVTVSKDVADEWSGTGSTMFLQEGEQISVDLLLQGIASVSANDGSVMLAVSASGSLEEWLREMNTKAQEIGMLDTHFGSPNGYPDEGRTFTTAHDLALLGATMIERHPELYRTYFGKPGMTHNGYTQANHDPISGVVPGADGIKTGFTREAGNNFIGSAERDGRRLVVVVAGIQGEAERARIVRDYIEWGFGSFASHEVFPEGAIIGAAKVQDGSADSVSLRIAQDVRASLPVGDQQQLNLSIRYSGPLVAPIRAGDQVAELELSGEGILPFRVPLIAANDVTQANWWQRIRNGLVGLVS